MNKWILFFVLCNVSSIFGAFQDFKKTIVVQNEFDIIANQVNVDTNKDISTSEKTSVNLNKKSYKNEESVNSDISLSSQLKFDFLREFNAESDTN